MKKIFLFIVIISGILCAGCHNDNMGFPRKIDVGREGDTLLVRSVNTGGWHVVDKNNESLAFESVVETEDGEVYVTEYDWLTVINRPGVPNDTVIVAPNTTGEPRTVYLYYEINYSLSFKAARIAINQR
ncbi:MAG: hypothetical protein HDT06_07945 [Bacteroidales bacterium]|nr:hypothetical protein [Bacteroidales bacterium]